MSIKSNLLIEISTFRSIFDRYAQEDSKESTKNNPIEGLLNAAGSILVDKNNRYSYKRCADIISSIDVGDIMTISTRDLVMSLEMFLCNMYIAVGLADESEGNNEEILWLVRSYALITEIWTVHQILNQ